MRRLILFGLLFGLIRISNAATGSGFDFGFGNLNASNLTTGTVPNSTLDSSSVTKQGNTFNGATTLVQTNSSSLVPNTLIDSSSVTKQGNSFNGASQLLQLDSNSAFSVSSATITTLKTTTMTVTGPIFDGTLTGGTSGQVLVTSGNGLAPFWSSPRIVQTTECLINTTSSSFATSFVPSNLTCSITPKYSTSKIYVSAAGAFHIGVSSNICYAAIFRNTTNLMNATFGGAEVGLGSGIGVNIALFSPLELHILDSPSAVVSTSYTVYIKQNTAGSSNTCILGDGLTQIMDLFEIGP